MDIGNFKRTRPSARGVQTIVEHVASAADSALMQGFNVRMDLVMQAGSLELEEVKKGKDDDEGSISYTSEFDTFGYDLSKREGRTEMPISFKFQGGYNLTVSLQCKFYKEKEVEHCQWGQALTYLDYDCEIKQGSSNIDVLKEKHCDKILS